jgi:hypothetical protein
MEQKNIDVDLIQETWILDDFSQVINGHHIFTTEHPGKKATEPVTEQEEESPPYFHHEQQRAGQPDPIKSGMIPSGCARDIALPASTCTDHLSKKVKGNVCSIYPQQEPVNRREVNS